MIKSRKNNVATKMRNANSEQPIGRQNDAQSPQRRDLGTRTGDQKSLLVPLGLAPGRPKMALAIHFGHRFEFSLALASFGLDFGSPGVSHELCWRHKLAPRLIIAYFAATSFYYALVGAFGAQLVLHLIILLTTCSYASLSISFAARLNALTAAFRR